MFLLNNDHASEYVHQKYTSFWEWQPHIWRKLSDTEKSTEGNENSFKPLTQMKKDFSRSLIEFEK